MTTVVAGTVETFDAESFRQGLATTVSVPASDVALEVEVASVRVTVYITPPGKAEDEAALLQALDGLTPSSLSAALGVTVESVGAVTIPTLSFTLPSPPPTSPPPLSPPTPPMLPPPSAPPLPPPPWRISAGEAVGVVLAAIATLIAIALVVHLCMRRAKERAILREKAKRARRRERAAKILQAAARQRNAKDFVVLLREERARTMRRERAVTLLQSMSRKKMAVKMIVLMKDLRVMNSTLLIQAATRRLVARRFVRHVRHKRKMLLDFQGMAVQLRTRAMRQFVAGVRVQARTRGMLARRRTMDLMIKLGRMRRWLAAVHVQAAVRGWRVRRHMPAYRRRLKLHKLTASLQRHSALVRRWRALVDAASHEAGERDFVAGALGSIASSPVWRTTLRMFSGFTARRDVRKHGVLLRLRLRLKRPARYAPSRVAIPRAFSGHAAFFATGYGAWAEPPAAELPPPSALAQEKRSKKDPR